MNNASTPRIIGQPATDPGSRFNGAAIIAPCGREIPITEAMIASALRALEEESFQWTFKDKQRCVEI